jgi:transketolase
MRKQLVKTVTSILEKDPRVVLFLGDIGVFAFREAFERFPDRVYNIGILEQASISVAAGLATQGMIPVFHTIAPFLVERCLDQLKVDFGYQKLGGNFISVGASYDYSSLGCTHHCPGDVQALKTIPGMQIVVPGHPTEFHAEFRDLYANEKPTYFRLSEKSNHQPHRSHGDIIQTGQRGTVVAIGPMLDRTIDACQDLDVAVMYHSVINPLHAFYLQYRASRKVVIVEPFYEGTMSYDVQRELGSVPASVRYIGVPRRFITSYGTPEQLDEENGLTTQQIRARIIEFLGV